MVRRFSFALACAFAGACSSTFVPTSPSHVAAVTDVCVAPPGPQHHNIPATFAGHPEGEIIWLCATQPRAYTAPDGRTVLEEDHYLQSTSCPAVPIQ